jgi:hypothetical protein
MAPVNFTPGSTLPFIAAALFAFACGSSSQEGADAPAAGDNSQAGQGESGGSAGRASSGGRSSGGAPSSGGDSSGGSAGSSIAGGAEGDGSGGIFGEAGDAGSGAVSGRGGAGTAGGAGTVGVGGAVGLACAGVEPRADVPGTTCRSAADCGTGKICAEQQPVGCGAELPPDRQCEAHDDCDAGDLCVEARTPASCTSGLATRCMAACTSDSCPEGERCNGGICELTPCDDGFQCAAGFVCAPERATSNAHGCAPRNCNEGYDCGAGYVCDPNGSGGCLAVHCREGGDSACPVNQTCDDESSGRGCMPKPCEVDADCDCGACIQRCSGADCPPGQCASRLWICTYEAVG